MDGNILYIPLSIVSGGYNLLTNWWLYANLHKF